MVKIGDRLHNPLTGETFVILKTSADTHGASLQMETHVPAKHGAQVPPHSHPAHAMRISILQGAMKLWIGQPQAVKIFPKGSNIAVPINTPYNWSITGDEIDSHGIRTATKILFESMCAIECASEKKLNPALASLSVLNRCRDHMYFSTMPVVIQKTVFAGVAFITKLAGYRDYYPYQEVKRRRHGNHSSIFQDHSISSLGRRGLHAW
jgi:quercetin dioxygenase-like cupin family protein